MVDTADQNRSDTRAGRAQDPAETRLRAAHVTSDSDDFIAMCAEALHPDGLHHVAAYHRGVYNYSVDILDGLGPSAVLPQGEDAASSRETYIRIGRQLNFLLGRMDRALRPVESGRLIRTVLRLGSASVYHYFVRPGEYLTGVSLGEENDEAGDRAMARLATRFGEVLRRRGLNYGGFEEENPTQPGPPPRRVVPGPVSKEDALHTDRLGVLGQDVSGIRALCAAALSADDLHYAAYVDPAAGSVAVDVLELAELGPFFSNISRQGRRERYQDIARRLPFVVARLDHSLKAVLPGRLTRTVLDVDEGALYYFALGNGAFLLGVTLHQDRVFQTDRRMNALSEAVERTVRENDTGTP
ncbi:hypothetical protein ACFY93_14835 [Streptomyces sp. NPDC008313]|uniref:hypothetical protein n=1 Tax=Streptomyces sp. NPDC008313 TaxID=3364826 RepID=UPI0036EE5121